MKEHTPRYTGRGDGKSSQGQGGRDVGIPPVEEPSHSQDVFFFPLTLSREEAMDPSLQAYGAQWSAKRHKAFPFLSFGQGVCTHTGSREPLGHRYPCSIQLIPPSQSVKGTQARPKFRVLWAT